MARTAKCEGCSWKKDGRYGQTWVQAKGAHRITMDEYPEIFGGHRPCGKQKQACDEMQHKTAPDYGIKEPGKHISGCVMKVSCMHRILRGCNCEITYSVQVSCCDSQNMHKIKYKKALTKEIKEPESSMNKSFVYEMHDHSGAMVVLADGVRNAPTKRICVSCKKQRMGNKVLSQQLFSSAQVEYFSLRSKGRRWQRAAKNQDMCHYTRYSKCTYIDHMREGRQGKGGKAREGRHGKGRAARPGNVHWH